MAGGDLGAATGAATGIDLATSRFRELDRPQPGDPVPTAPPRQDPPPDTVYTGPDGREIRLPTFEIGLVLAGAVSAGAYTAGVLDLLIEVLDRWEAAKLANIAEHGDDFARWTVPPHAVRLTAVAGASAGSVCAAILAASAHGKFPSGDRLSPRVLKPGDAMANTLANPLYDVWVRRLDILGMLDASDLNGGVQTVAHLQSLLNTKPLDDAARGIVSMALPPADRRPWLEKGVEFGFTLGNLTGVPYRYRLVGLDGADFATTRHADMFGFRLAGADEPKTLLPPDCTPGNPWCLGAAGPVLIGWSDVAAAALASAAFPVALKARHLEKEVAGYNRAVQLSARYLKAPGPVLETDEDRARFAGKSPEATWTQGANVVAGTVNTILRQTVLPFTAVDGGTMNNQPFEYVRRAIAGPMGSNPRDGDKAIRAVVLIDPFPAQREADVSVDEATPSIRHDSPASSSMQPMSLLDVLPRLLRAYINQSRYDANDLSLAADPNVYSRFMLSPVRAGPDGRTLTGEKALASGGLSAFAGFLSESYRHHDFLLGRRNAEYFLRSYFALPPENRLFKNAYWGGMGTAQAPSGPYWTITSVEGRHERQIIPVVIDPLLHAQHQPAVGLGEARVLDRLWAIRRRLTSPHPEWPGSWTGVEAVLQRIEAPLEARLKRSIAIVRASLPKGVLWSAVSLVLGTISGKLARDGRKKLGAALDTQLRACGLDRPQKLPEPPEDVF